MTKEIKETKEDKEIKSKQPEPIKIIKNDIKVENDKVSKEDAITKVQDK